MRENCLQNTFAILQHLVVPEAKHLPPLARQISVTDIVTKVFRVLRAVGLDDELSANAKKVDNVRSDRNLPPKLDAIQATIAQDMPEAQLAVGRRSAHRASTRALVRRDAEVGLHRSSISGKTLIRRVFGAPPSPRGRSGAAPQFAPTFFRREKDSGTPLCPSVSLREKVAGEAGRMRALASRLRKRPARRRELLQQRRRLEIVAELGLKFLELGKH
jgi:hypothetical protein